jgi:DNA-binding NtrC family response regulator
MTRILVVDDESLLAAAIAKRLARDGYDCQIAETLGDGRAKAAGADLILLDMRLPDGNGLDLLADRDGGGEHPPVIMLTAFGDVESAVAAMKLGATDYLRKPVDLDELALVVGRTLAGVELRHRLDYSRERESHAAEDAVLLGDSPALVETRARIQAIAALAGDGEPPSVLILGETGTGKDLAARLLHRLGANADGPFVRVDCATLPKDTIEEELFGRAETRIGLIEAAESGTLFLDEIGELPLGLQPKLLNVIERREARRIGAARAVPVAARFVAASNRPLARLAADGGFRGDLYYRLNVLSLDMPPLRDCPGDAALLADHFAALTARRHGRPTPRFDDAARTALNAYGWPGNARELKHLVERAVLLSRATRIAEADLMLSPPAAVEPTAPETGLDRLTLEAAERRLIERALEQCGGNVSKAARQLGVTRMALRYRIQRHGLGTETGESESG